MQIADSGASATGAALNSARVDSRRLRGVKTGANMGVKREQHSLPGDGLRVRKDKPSSLSSLSSTGRATDS